MPCNVYGGAVPTVAQIAAATGGESIAFCTVDSRAGSLPSFSATVQSEFSQPFSVGVEGYLRGLATFNGNSKNDPSNPFDDVDAYALFNLFAGLRDPEGGWEIGVFAKNLFDTHRVLTREPTAANVSYQQLFCSPSIPAIAFACPTGAIAFGQQGVSGYRVISTTAPREFGITARIGFGSRWS